MNKLNITEHVSLKKYTTFRCGGEARFFAEPSSFVEVSDLLAFASSESMPVFVMGMGSNILVSDSGFDGLVIRLGRNMGEISLMDTGDSSFEIDCGAGAPLALLGNLAVKEGLEGCEFCCGIPGSVGGGVFMNAGAYGREIKDIAVSVTYLEAGEVKTMPASSCEFGYRKSIFTKDLIGRKGLRLDERPVRKLGVMIIVACIPTAIIGFALGDVFEGLYSKPIAIAIMFVITGILLILAETYGGGNRTIENLNYRNSLFIGLVQGIAIIPGISRSGSTLFSSLLCKLDRDFAVKFVFLISIPTILGSVILELPDGIKEGVSGSDWGPVIVGVIVSFISGLFAVKVMLKVVKNRKLKYFSYYLFVLAVIVVVYTLIKG